MKRILWLMLLVLIVTGCDRNPAGKATPTTQGSVRETTAVTLQLNWKPEPQFGGFYAAKQNGGFEDHALNVDVVAGGVGTPTVQMVAAGKVEFGIVSADELILARSNGADVVALFAVYQTCPQGLMTHAARGFKSIADIFTNPGTVAMQRGLPYASYLERKYGFDKVKAVPSPGGDLSVFRSDPNYSMQCFVTSEPIAAKRAGLDAQTFLVAEAGYNPYTTVLVTRGDYLKSNKKLAGAMVAAVREGWRKYLDDPSATNSHMQQLNPTMDSQTLTESAAAQKPLIETDETKKGQLGIMTNDRWETLVKQLTELKVIQKPVDPATCFVQDLKEE